MTEPVSSLTKIGNEFTFEIGAGSPLTYTSFCAVYDAGNIGENKPQIDVTSLCDQARVYRSGLADGASFTLKCNFLDADTALQGMYTAYKANALQTFRLLVNGVSPAEYFQFQATITGWQVLVPVGAKAELNFTLKISGSVTWQYT